MQCFFSQYVFLGRKKYTHIAYMCVFTWSTLAPRRAVRTRTHLSGYTIWGWSIFRSLSINRFLWLRHFFEWEVEICCLRGGNFFQAKFHSKRRPNRPEPNSNPRVSKKALKRCLRSRATQAPCKAPHLWMPTSARRFFSRSFKRSFKKRHLDWCVRNVWEYNDELTSIWVVDEKKKRERTNLLLLPLLKAGRMPV